MCVCVYVYIYIYIYIYMTGAAIEQVARLLVRLLDQHHPEKWVRTPPLLFHVPLTGNTYTHTHIYIYIYIYICMYVYMYIYITFPTDEGAAPTGRWSRV